MNSEEIQKYIDQRMEIQGYIEMRVENEVGKQLRKHRWREVKGNFISFSLAIVFVQLLIGVFDAIL